MLVDAIAAMECEAHRLHVPGTHPTHHCRQRCEETVPSPQEIGFSKARAAFTDCIRSKLGSFGELSTHPVTGAIGTTSLASTSWVVGLWAVNMMKSDWRRGT